ncbi:hypothetical protein Tco_0682141 [Tanacetum coccineum]|uniref:Uncharacterized protein n=1 Tax=Tanacetum coccineum TaxID=301880 RepID=A0ABQ4XQD1_9ASTR
MENKLHKNSYPAAKGAGNPSGVRPLKSILKKTLFMPHATMEASTDQHRTKGASGVENAPNAPHICVTNKIPMKAAGIEPDPNIGVNDKSGNGMFNAGCDAGTKPDISHVKTGSFASVVNSAQDIKKVNFRSLVNTEKMENFDMVLPKSVIDKVKNKFKNSLVGYFVEEDNIGVPKPTCTQETIVKVSSGVKNKSPIGGGKKNLVFSPKLKIHYFHSDGTVFDDLDQEVEIAEYKNGRRSLSSSYESVS